MSEKSTTPDLVELLRHWLDAWNRRDFDAGMSIYAHDAVFTSHGIGAFEGQAAIRVFNEDWLASFEGMTGKFEEVRDLGNGVTFAVIVLDSRPHGSSVDVRLRFAAVAEWVKGLVVRTRNYTDIDEARAAAVRLAQERADG